MTDFCKVLSPCFALFLRQLTEKNKYPTQKCHFMSYEQPSVVLSGWWTSITKTLATGVNG